MGDSGEGLVDAEARIHERMDELARAKRERALADGVDPEKAREAQTLKLRRAELEQQRRTTTDPKRRAMIDGAIEKIDQKLSEIS